MATGRRDYTWGFLNEAAGEGRYRGPFNSYFSSLLSPYTSVSLYQYTVPVGKKVSVNTVYITTDSFFRSIVYFYRGEEEIGRIYFSVNYCFDFSDINPIVFEAGEIIKVRVYNGDEVAAIFVGNVIGVIEDVIS